MNVSIVNAQEARHIRRGNLKRLARFLLSRSAERSGFQWGDISIVLADHSTSQRVNRAHLGHDYPTDVITFHFAPVPGTDNRLTDGEILVNVEYACQRGHRYGGVQHELALYIAHGCDHLAGEDDQSSANRNRMRRRELRWLREARQSGLNFEILD
jgi:probable rRNA maturation factor